LFVPCVMFHRGQREHARITLASAS
jgi:hypothetical protein